jgi:hypothetical protein
MMDIAKAFSIISSTIIFLTAMFNTWIVAAFVFGLILVMMAMDSIVGRAN